MKPPKTQKSSFMYSMFMLIDAMDKRNFIDIDLWKKRTLDEQYSMLYYANYIYQESAKRLLLWD